MRFFYIFISATIIIFIYIYINIFFVNLAANELRALNVNTENIYDEIWKNITEFHARTIIR